ncbi:MAG: response regulator, partial [Desulfobacterales bacterium]|nr:response regulator [Desulfobacterales bacterium]
ENRDTNATAGKNILFVDDEIYLAEVGKEMLEDYGYEVDITTDSLIAFDLFKRAPLRYDLLITDYTMPGMTGDQLMEAVRRIRPELPVIVCTGITLPTDVMERISTATLLMKPFDMDDILRTVQGLLEDTGT